MKNRFGHLFSITTWGESHGPAIGVVIDGCPAGLSLSEEDFHETMQRRRPGYLEEVSQRKEPDTVLILSGVFNNTTLGTPISLLIQNQDAQSSQYASTKHLYRPGHGDITYAQKYGIYDYRGGGRSSARETCTRVAASVVAKKILERYQIDTTAFVSQVGSLQLQQHRLSHETFHYPRSSSYQCASLEDEHQLVPYLKEISQNNDSVGGTVTFQTSSLPPGLGEPIFSKLEACLASAMLSIPGTKGFEIGLGFGSASMQGSNFIDTPEIQHDQIRFPSNHSGGTLGGISTGEPIYGKVAFKPTSSIGQPVPTLTTNHLPALLQLSPKKRHDPCIAIRGAVVVEAMCNLVLADLVLLSRTSQF